jgi:hypothetical protein
VPAGSEDRLDPAGTEASCYHTGVARRARNLRHRRFKYSNPHNRVASADITGLISSMCCFLRSVVLTLALSGCLVIAVDASLPVSSVVSPDSRFTVGERLLHDDFAAGLGNWQSELEKAGTVRALNGMLEIDVPGGCTVWMKTELSGAVLISYEAMMVAGGGPNDRVSDLNCFWMAQDTRSPGKLFATSRNGIFSDYDQLRCYYVGHGGNSNTTTRFRRYVGEKGNRPLRPEHDLSAPEFLLAPNTPLKIQLVAAGSTVEYFSNGRCFFAYDDPEPYVRGWFGFRTVTSHFQIRNFTIHRLLPRGSVSE